MTKLQMKIAGQILYIASDKRSRITIDDEIEWLEQKMKEIRRLVRKLPREKAKHDKYGVLKERIK